MITDEQIRHAWAAYYPKRRSETESALNLPATLRASCPTRAGFKHRRDRGESNNHLCFTIGIPKSEFEEVRNDLPEL